MAATGEARRLTEAHRLAQLRIGRQTVRQLASTWPLLDMENLDATTQQWLRVALPLIRAQRVRSARLAANYLVTFRALELGVSSAAIVPVVADTVEARALLTSLTVTGPASVKAAMRRGIRLGVASDTAQARMSAAGMRHALNGGRDTILETVADDRRALGYARATSGRSCHFCAMLASRGPVYKADTADFQAHDHCSCTVEPVYRDDSDWPPGAQRYREIWDTTTAGLSGKEAIAAFREAISA